MLIPQPWTLLKRVFGYGTPKAQDRVVSKSLRELNLVSLTDIMNLFTDFMSPAANRFQLYREYDIFTLDDIPLQVINLIAEEAVQADVTTGKTIWVESENPNIEKVATELFEKIKVEKHLYSMAFELAKYGDCFSGIANSRTESGIPGGIIDILPAPVYSTTRLEDAERRLTGWIISPIEQITNTYVPYLGSVKNKEATDPPWSFIHMRLAGWNRIFPYGASFLMPARRLYRRLRLCEDAMMSYRIKRAPDRFVFALKNLASLAPEERADAMRKIRQELRKKVEIDRATGQMKAEIDPIGVDEDFIVDEEAMTITRLPGSTQINSVLDIDYLRKRFIGCVGVPPDYLGFSDSPGSFAADIPLMFQDVTFARKIKRLQAGIMEGITDLVMIHLAWLGIDPLAQENQFVVKMNFVSAIDEKQRLEAEKVRAETLEILQAIGKELDVDPGEWAQYIMQRSGIPKKYIAKQGEISKLLKGTIPVITASKLAKLDNLVESDEGIIDRFDSAITDLRSTTDSGTNVFRSEMSDMNEHGGSRLPMVWSGTDAPGVLDKGKILEWQDRVSNKKPVIQKNIMSEINRLIDEDKKKLEEQKRSNEKNAKEITERSLERDSYMQMANPKGK